MTVDEMRELLEQVCSELLRNSLKGSIAAGVIALGSISGCGSAVDMYGAPYCAEDADGNVDCSDPACVDHPQCEPVDMYGAPNCAEDADGNVDCSDPACEDHPDCE